MPHFWTIFPHFSKPMPHFRSDEIAMLSELNIWRMREGMKNNIINNLWFNWNKFSQKLPPFFSFIFPSKIQKKIVWCSCRRYFVYFKFLRIKCDKFIKFIKVMSVIFKCAMNRSNCVNLNFKFDFWTIQRI